MAKKKTLRDIDPETANRLIDARRDCLILRDYGFFDSILLNPDRLHEVCRDYLSLDAAPNLAGLAASLGTTVHRLIGIFDKKSLDPPEEASLEVLSSTITLIEALTVSAGMMGLYQSNFAKFYLSAFHNRNEKTLSESNNRSELRVVLQSHEPISLEEMVEYARLKESLECQSSGELSQLGRDGNAHVIEYDGDLSI